VAITKPGYLLFCRDFGGVWRETPEADAKHEMLINGNDWHYVGRRKGNDLIDAGRLSVRYESA